MTAAFKETCACHARISVFTESDERGKGRNKGTHWHKAPLAVLHYFRGPFSTLQRSLRGWERISLSCHLIVSLRPESNKASSLSVDKYHANVVDRNV